MSILKKIGCWFLAVLCACVGIAIDYGLIAYHKPGTRATCILVMVLFFGLFGLLAYSLIAKSKKQNPPLITSQKWIRGWVFPKSGKTGHKRKWRRIRSKRDKKIRNPKS